MNMLRFRPWLFALLTASGTCLSAVAPASAKAPAVADTLRVGVSFLPPARGGAAQQFRRA